MNGDLPSARTRAIRPERTVVIGDVSIMSWSDGSMCIESLDEDGHTICSVDIDPGGQREMLAEIAALALPRD